ncbi:hypothetical protein GCM10010360_26260 [Streptomyces nogalater]
MRTAAGYPCREVVNNPRFSLGCSVSVAADGVFIVSDHALYEFTPAADGTAYIGVFNGLAAIRDSD